MPSRDQAARDFVNEKLCSSPPPLVRGPLLPIWAARALAGLLFVGAVGLPWLANWQGVLVRPEGTQQARQEQPPVAVQYRPELVLVPGGRFWMGSSAEERAAFAKYVPENLHDNMDDETRREVEVESLYVARTEVTLAQWEAVMGTRPNDCEYGCADNHPVSNVSWNDACAYVDALTGLENEVLRQRGETELTPCYVQEGTTWVWPEERRGCTGYRLPAEAEWEYIARADTSTAYFFGDDPRDMCDHGNGADEALKYKRPEEDQPEKVGPILPCDDEHAGLAPVGSFKANPWGLYDVHGNVWEWVWDQFEVNPAEASNKSSKGKFTGGRAIPERVAHRILRGGSFWVRLRRLRAASREQVLSSDRDATVGLRCVRSGALPGLRT